MRIKTFTLHLILWDTTQIDRERESEKPPALDLLSVWIFDLTELQNSKIIRAHSGCEPTPTPAYHTEDSDALKLHSSGY